MALAMVPLAMMGQTTNQLLSENFDSMSSIATSYSATGWYAYNAGSGNNWTLNTSASYAHSGAKSAQVQFNSSNAANCYLVSEPFTVNENLTDLKVSLYERVRLSNYQETFDVFFVKASDITSTNTTIINSTHYEAIASANYTNTSFALKEGSVQTSDIQALAGQSVRVIVHCSSAAGKYYLYIDDIVVTETYSTDNAVTVTTNSTYTYLSSRNITMGGTLVDPGDAPTECGICYMEGTTGDPTYASSKVTAGTTSNYNDPFEVTLSGLTPNTSYRVRAYAKSQSGYAYGNTITVTTLSSDGSDPESSSTTTSTIYKKVSADLTTNEKYLIVNISNSGIGNALSYTTGSTAVTNDDVTVNAATYGIDAEYINAADVDANSVWTCELYTTVYRFKNNGNYLRFNGTSSVIILVDTGTSGAGLYWEVITQNIT